jgi:NADPH:quinone reductase-like Zn-dependent oxidoreductase
MKAVVYTKYGPPEVLQLKEVGKPVPGDNEVLIKVRATTVTSGDVRLRGFIFPRKYWLLTRMVFGLRKPRKITLGSEFSGEIEEVGKNVKLFKRGDKVLGSSGMRFGTYAEYICLPEKGMLAIKPANMTFEEAAAVPFGGLTALCFLRKGNIRSGDKALIYGASGGVGTAAVQIARSFGAGVTGVCSAANLELVKSLGAESVIDYNKENFAEHGGPYNIVFDAVGKISKWNLRKVLASNGAFVSVAKGLTKAKTEDLIFLKDLIEAEKLKTVIDRRYPLEQIAKAHSYVEKGHKKGNVVITLEHNMQTS